MLPFVLRERKKETGPADRNLLLDDDLSFFNGVAKIPTSLTIVFCENFQALFTYLSFVDTASFGV